MESNKIIVYLSFNSLTKVNHCWSSRLTVLAIFCLFVHDRCHQQIKPYYTALNLKFKQRQTISNLLA